MVLTADLYDMAVLVSGDSDLLRPLELVRARGKQVKVISSPSTVAWELREFAGQNFIDLHTLEDRLRDTGREWRKEGVRE